MNPRRRIYFMCIPASTEQNAIVADIGAACRGQRSFIRSIGARFDQFTTPAILWSRKTWLSRCRTDQLRPDICRLVAISVSPCCISPSLLSSRLCQQACADVLVMVGQCHQRLALHSRQEQEAELANAVSCVWTLLIAKLFWRSIWCICSRLRSIKHPCARNP